MDIDEVVETSDAEEMEEMLNGVVQSPPEDWKHQKLTRAPEVISYYPPRKRLKTSHEASDLLSKSMNRLTASPTKSAVTNSVSPLRSRSSSTLHNAFPSTGSMSISSSSSQTSFPNPGMQKQETLTESTQDPLLLASSSQRPIDSPATPSRSPSASRPGSRGRSSSSPHYLMTPSLLHSQPPATTMPPSSPNNSLFSRSTTPLSSSQAVQPSRPFEEDALLMFTPSRPTPSALGTESLSPVSPLTVSPAASGRVPSPATRPISSLPPSPSPTQSAPPPEPVIDITNMLEYGPESRYSLRKRNVAQLNPYTVDDIRYKRALRSNPEAIVKLKAIERHLNQRLAGNHYRHEGETQQDTYVDDGDVDEDPSWEEKERRRLELRTEKQRRRAERERLHVASEQDATKYPDILQDLSNSDEEGLDSIAKEARRAQRRIEKEKRAREKEERHRQREERARKAKKFPVHRTQTPVTDLPTTRHSPSSPNRYGDDLEDSNIPQFHDTNTGNGTDRSSRQPPSSNNETHSMQDYFGEDDGFASETISGRAPEIDVHRSSHPASPSHQPPTLQEEFPGGQDDSGVSNEHPWMDNVEPPADERANSDPPIINISDDDEGPSQANSKVSDIELDLPPQKQRWLRKMYPKSMMKDLTKMDAKGKKSKKTESKRRAVSVVSDGEQPLLPGQSRIQKTANPKDIRDIKGDSESESDRDNNATASSPTSPRFTDNAGDSDSDVVEILETYRPRTQAVKKHIVVEKIYSSEDEIDDEDIQEIFFPDEKASTSSKYVSRLRDESLIDYMLTRWRNIGGARKKTIPSARSSSHRNRTSTPSTSKYIRDILPRSARGMGRSHQPTLSFDRPETSKKRKHPGFTPKPAGPIPSRHASSSRTGRKHTRSNDHTSALEYHRSIDYDENSAGEHVDDDTLMHVLEDHGSRRLTWEEKKKMRKQQIKRNGLYVNTNRQYIDSGTNRNHYTTTIEQEEARLAKVFHLALAPNISTQAQREHWSKQFKPPKAKSPPRRIARAREDPHDAADEDGGPRISQTAKCKLHVEYAVDLHVHLLHAGKSFGAISNIGKGWLYELVHLASTKQEPVQPMSLQRNGYTVNSDITVEGLCAMLPLLVDSFFEFVTALPDPDQESTVTQWSMLAHVMCQHISWHLNKAGDTTKALLLEVVEGQIVQIVDRINKLALTFIDTPVLTFGWLAVEMSVRIGLNEPDLCISGHLKSSITAIMNILIQSDVLAMIKHLQQDSTSSDGVSASKFAAEVWVCLIHVLDIYLPKDNRRNKYHPFWSILLEVLRARTRKEEDMLPADASEKAWSTIFVLCSFSQFSIHGVTSGQPRLPACWDLAVYALKKIRLTATPEETINEATKKRDEYVAIVVKRCLLLHERWKWDLQDASPMFNTLSDIFKSRKFANLLHEESDFAEFFKSANWDLLLSSDPKDTAYNVFLKLIVQAAREDPVYIQRKTSPKVKKWLSLAVPLGAVTLPSHMSKEESQRHISMFYNRLSAVAVAVDLDLGEYDDRTSKARTYLDFKMSDHTTRFAIMRGLCYWAIMLVARKVKLNAIVDWIHEMAVVIEVDLKKCQPPSGLSTIATAENPLMQKAEEKQKQKDQGHGLLFTNCLFAIVRKIIDAHAKAGLYPEPAFIVALKPVLTSWIAKDTRVLTEFGLLAKTLFAARSAVLPPPPRLPPLPAPADDEQESQDFGFDDFGNMDWNNVNLPEALGPHANETTIFDVDKDAALLQALTTVRFKWIISAYLKPFVQPPPPQNHLRQRHELDCDDWVRYFLCCSSLEKQEDKWPKCIKLLNVLMEDVVDESWIIRVQLSVMFQLLKIDPMAYSIMEGLAMKVFIWALVSDHIAIEKEYVAQFLSVAGLRHPLLHGASLPDRRDDAEDFMFSSQEFMEERFDYIRIIFHNLNQFIHDQLTGQYEQALHNEEYIEALKSMLSTMRSRYKSLNDPQKRATYEIFCHRVFTLYQEYPELYAHEHLKFWRGWRTIFAHNP